MHRGDQLSFTAGGRICIDLGGLSQEVQTRWKDEETAASTNRIRRNDDKETRVPEEFFSGAQRAELILERPWTGPSGFDYLTDFRGRMKRLLFPKEKAGGLVAAISTLTGKESDTDWKSLAAEAFFVGDGTGLDRPPEAKEGFLWFTVNDVQYDDPANPYLFYNDNIGSFWVKVVIKRRSRFSWGSSD